jgi:acetylornithine deacetylase/succinyl-diaminopimelate desuccinylase-like protein
MSVQAVLDWLDAHESESIERLKDWLRIPSVSADPEYQPHMIRAAEWAAGQLRAAGLKAEIVPADPKWGARPGHPMVLATSEGAANYRGPHVLFYGHYDVQPVDPIELWERDPFDPAIAPATPNGPGERIVARGAVDDKGQVATFLEALRAWKEAGGTTAGGVKFTVLLEGEEECGSETIEKYLHAAKDRLGACDVCLISDTGMLGRGRPAITYGLRGMAYTEIVLHAADRDLHSGLWGGKTPNPIGELAKVLAQLWDVDRRVTIPGFYDDVRELAPVEREAWAKLGIDPAAMLAKIGLPPEASVGEAGYTFTEREWARPTAEINGIYGGYAGPGAKTVIPAKAGAKVSFRLVADQVPSKIIKQFFKWLGERTPAGCRWETIEHSQGWPATVATDSPHLAAARRAMKAASGVDPVLIKTGGSIPIAGSFKSELGLDTIFMGFGLDDDRIHSPNEKFELDCFRLGARSHALFIHELANAK